MTTPVEPTDPQLAFLYGRIDYERFHTPPAAMKLDRMRQLAARIGAPQERLPVVHVAGTKGKGSTAAMIAAALSAAGHRTGLFTSPHIHRIEERIAVDGRPIVAAELSATLAALRPAIATMDAADDPPTFFEILTAAAMHYFVGAAVDLAVLEVGLGGRLDATNICRPLVSVITSISLDHTQQLGGTVESIAREKAGIIKPGVPVVSGVADVAAASVVRQTCARLNAPLVEIGRDVAFRYTPPRDLQDRDAVGRVDVDTTPPVRDLPLPLPGRHQAANTALAVATLAELRRRGWAIAEDELRRGLAGLRWPARVEVVRRRPAIVIDAAHNVASVEALLQTLGESFGPRRRLLVFAGTRDKDLRGMLARLLPAFDEVFLTTYRNNPRGVPAAELAALAAEVSARRHAAYDDSAQAVERALAAATADDLVCVTGSFFIAAEVRALLLDGAAAGEAGV